MDIVFYRNVNKYLTNQRHIARDILISIKVLMSFTGTNQSTMIPADTALKIFSSFKIIHEKANLHMTTPRGVTMHLAHALLFFCKCNQHASSVRNAFNFFTLFYDEDEDFILVKWQVFSATNSRLHGLSYIIYDTSTLTKGNVAHLI